MRTVHEVSALTGVSIRTLHYYDDIGLLRPTDVTEAGYRLYDDNAMERLQDILLFRELAFPLREIQSILSSDGFDRGEALRQQIELLTLKKEHLENLIAFARTLTQKGMKNMDFSAFDRTKMDAYAKEAKQKWADTAAYKEYEQKSAGRSTEDEMNIGDRMMAIFAEIGKLRTLPATDEAVQALVEKLRAYITANFYNCTPEILSGLGQMYACGGEFTDNIDKAGGAGTAKFAAEAIEAYCKAQS